MAKIPPLLPEHKAALMRLRPEARSLDVRPRPLDFAPMTPELRAKMSPELRRAAEQEFPDKLGAGWWIAGGLAVGGALAAGIYLAAFAGKKVEVPLGPQKLPEPVTLAKRELSPDQKVVLTTLLYRYSVNGTAATPNIPSGTLIEGVRIPDNFKGAVDDATDFSLHAQMLAKQGSTIFVPPEVAAAAAFNDWTKLPAKPIAVAVKDEAGITAATNLGWFVWLQPIGS